ncbi:hypothetical protein [Flavobacterium sp.]|uniref:hypothetical protein n=1 Tax=Flavobacterium sp. TaxID=239 RepID=UPI00375101B7
MKNIFRYILILLLIGITSCNKKNKDFKFYFCDFALFEDNNPFKDSKWVENKEDALKTKLTFYNSDMNKRNLDSLYKQTAQYLFIIGGGGIWVKAESCSAEIKNDTILLKYKVKKNYGQVGEAVSSLICMEINKRKYPNYRELKIKYIQE